MNRRFQDCERLKIDESGVESRVKAPTISLQLLVSNPLAHTSCNNNIIFTDWTSRAISLNSTYTLFHQISASDRRHTTCVFVFSYSLY